MSNRSAGMSDEAVKAATGRDWAAWRRLLDTRGAGGLDHARIVPIVAEHGASGWWSQMVAVGYERMIGRRALGQRCDGAYSAGASRTLAGDKDAALARWQELAEGRVEFAGAVAEGEPRITRSDKWRYWRIDLDDGSRVTVNFSDKPGGKSLVAVGHDKVENPAAADRSKTFWKALLAEI